MAFTSDMIPRLVYMYAYQPEGEMNMKGYINNSLSVFYISEIQLANSPEEGENPPWFNSSITTCRCVLCGFIKLCERGRKTDCGYKKVDVSTSMLIYGCRGRSTQILYSKEIAQC